MQTISFENVADQWLTLKKMQVKPSTFVKYQTIWEVRLKPSFGQYQLVEISEEAVMTFFLDQMEKTSGSLLQTMRYLLKAMLGYARHKYGQPTISFNYIKLPPAKMRTSTLSHDEEARLDEYWFSHCNDTSIGILLGLYGGLRIGEICGLKWADIDLEEGLIYVQRTIQRISDTSSSKKTQVVILDPKTPSSQRIVPLTDFMNQFLKKYQASQTDVVADHFLLSGSDVPLEPRTLQYRYHRICKKLDIQLTFHGLRHSFATRCIEQQVDPKSLSEMLGHADVTTTLKRYVHSSLSFKKEQMAKIKSAVLFAE